MTQDQLYRRVSVILKSVLQAARSSWESHQDAESYSEIRTNTADYKILGISISTVKLQDAHRENNVTKLIGSRRNNSFEDMSQKQEINRFSEEAQKTRRHEPHRDLRTLRKSPKNMNVLIAMAVAEIGIIYCSCWRK